MISSQVIDSYIELESTSTDVDCCLNPHIGEVDGFNTCVHCGMIYDNVFYNEQIAIRTHDDIVNKQNNEVVIIDYGPRTIMNNIKDCNGHKLDPKKRNDFDRLIKIHYYLKDSYERNQWNANPLFKRLRNLHLPPNIIKDVKRIYNEAVKQSLTKGRKIDTILAAALCCAIKMNSIPVEFETIADFFQIERKPLFRAYQLVFNKLLSKLKANIRIKSPTDYVNRYGNELNLPISCISYAIELVNNVRKKGLIICGKDPKAIAGASLILSVDNYNTVSDQRQNIKLNQKELVSLTKASLVTLRKRRAEIVEILNSTQNKEKEGVPPVEVKKHTNQDEVIKIYRPQRADRLNQKYGTQYFAGDREELYYIRDWINAIQKDMKDGNSFSDSLQTIGLLPEFKTKNSLSCYLYEFTMHTVHLLEITPHERFFKELQRFLDDRYINISGPFKIFYDRLLNIMLKKQNSANGMVYIKKDILRGLKAYVLAFRKPMDVQINQYSHVINELNNYIKNKLKNYRRQQLDTETQELCSLRGWVISIQNHMNNGKEFLDSLREVGMPPKVYKDHIMSSKCLLFTRKMMRILKLSSIDNFFNNLREFLNSRDTTSEKSIKTFCNSLRKVMPKRFFNLKNMRRMKLEILKKLKKFYLGFRKSIEKKCVQFYHDSKIILRQLEKVTPELKERLDSFFSRYPGLKKYRKMIMLVKILANASEDELIPYQINAFQEHPAFLKNVDKAVKLIMKFRAFLLRFSNLLTRSQKISKSHRPNMEYDPTHRISEISSIVNISLEA